MRNLKYLIQLISGDERRKLFRLGLLACLVFVAGCSQNPTPTASVLEGGETAVPVEASPGETRVLPTLFPTPSPFPTPGPTQPLPTSTPRPTATPIDFSELVVEVHFAIPGLDLARTIRGNVSSQIEIIDETTGQSFEITDLPGVMFELQQSLPEMELSSLPDDCDFCVQVSYELFLAGESDEGWLEDPVLLASFENFFNAYLGPHFPPETVIGFRRSATPYYVAHTVALTAGGELWRWTATEAEINGPEVGGESLLALLEELSLETIASEYLGPCPEGSGYETLYLKQGEEEQTVDLVCPELALALPLLPLFLALDELADEITADEALPQPEPTVPLESVLYYQRQDGSVLILFADARARAVTDDGLSATAELAENQSIDTALALADSGLLQLGVIHIVSNDSANILIARGLDGVYEIGWNDAVPANLGDFVTELNELLDELLENAVRVGTVTPTPDPDATPETSTPTPASTGAATPDATPTP